MNLEIIILNEVSQAIHMFLNVSKADWKRNKDRGIKSIAWVPGILASC